MLLETKLHPPPLRPDLVARPDLLQRLDAGLHRRLTLISAPAGYGKTALIGMWVRHLPDVEEFRPVAQIALDEGDNIPARFFSYLTAALRLVDEHIGTEVRAALETPQLPPVETLLTSLVNDIERVSTPFILVLDDYHAINEAAIHEAFDWILERQPSKLHLVISTRHDPPLALSRLRGRDQITEIRQSDLRFGPAESGDFLNRVMNLSLDRSEIEALQQRTEGWVTGLQLAALSLRGCDAPEVDRFIAGFSGRHHFVLDYLTDEVVQRQPERIQQFLLQTSILERLCSPLCNAILEPSSDRAGWGDSQDMLDILDHANLFLIPLDNQRRWYRYHNLFAQLLQARLQETGPDLAARLHRRAATWFEEGGHAAEAVHHALATGDSDRAADLIERLIRRLSTWTRIDIATFSHWLGRLPNEAVLARPWLQLFRSRVLYLDGQVDAADHALEELQRSLANIGLTPSESADLDLTIRGDLLSYATMRGEVRYAINAATRMMEELAPRGRFATVRPAVNLATAYMQAGDVRQAGLVCAAAIADAQAAGLPLIVPTLIGGLALVEITEGHLGRALAICLEAIESIGAQGAAGAVLGRLRLIIAEILYEQNELSSALQQAVNGLNLIGSGWSPEGLVASHAVMGRIQQAIGQSRAAVAHVRQAVDIARQSGIARISLIASAHQARQWLAQGNLVAASRWAEDYRQLGAAEYLREFQDLTLARVLRAQGGPAEALSLLDHLLPMAEAAGRMGHVVEMLVLKALALQDQDQGDAALQALGGAIQLAQPENYVRIFVDEGAPMARLLRAAIHKGIDLDYAAALLKASGDQLDGQRKIATEDAPSVARSILAEPLTGREMHVLTLLAQGLSNGEIAQRLFISLPTVKSHTSHIYQKLGVHHRGEAIARARALHLL
jgi:LuxR family maltose regulon positive regulatory protein